MASLISLLSEKHIRDHFAPCADFIVKTAADEVCSIIRRVNASSIPGLTAMEIARLRTFEPAPELFERQKQLVVQKFVSGQQGAKRLYVTARQNIAQLAVRAAVTPYSRSFGIPGIKYYQDKYEFLFVRLGLPPYRINQVDPNLNNDMPHSPVRLGRVRRAPSPLTGENHDAKCRR